jgi:hypothetical protein
VGSVCKPVGILNRSAGSGAMQAWRQNNFTGVLNRPAGSEAMFGKQKSKKMLAANPFFSRLLSKAAYTPCGILINLCRIVLMDMCLVFATITIQFRLSFHNCKCENTYFVDYTVVVFLICWLILDHWFIV